MINRRSFVKTSALGVAGSVLGAPVRPQEAAGTYFEWQELADGVRVAWGGGGASLVVSSDGESLLVDTKGYGLGTTLRREVEADGNELVGVVNTHHHAAQMGGNVAFTPDVAVVSQRRAARQIVSAVERVVETLQENPDGTAVTNRRRAIADAAHSDAGRRQALEDFDALVAGGVNMVPGNYGPSATFDDFLSIRVGFLDVELHHFGPGHTDNDVVVWIPSLFLMHVGNLVYIDEHPFIDAPRGGETRGWQRSLDKIHDLAGAESTIIPSDGGLIAQAHDLDVQKRYFDHLRDIARNALDAGMGRDEAVDYLPASAMNRFPRMAQTQRLAPNLQVVYDELLLER